MGSKSRPVPRKIAKLSSKVLSRTARTALPQATAYGNKNEFLFLRPQVQALLRFDARYSFVRSGFIAMSTGRLWYAGVAGYNWSSLALSSPESPYYLDFNASGAYSSSSRSRWFGFPLRCLSCGGCRSFAFSQILPVKKSIRPKSLSIILWFCPIWISHRLFIQGFLPEIFTFDINWTTKKARFSA